MPALQGMGKWLKANGEAIYGTRVCAPYKKDSIAFTKKGDCIYAIQLFEEENPPMEQILVQYA